MAPPHRQNCARNAPKAPATKKTGNAGSKLGKMTPRKRAPKAPRARKTGNSANPASTASSTRAQRLTAPAARSNSYRTNPHSNHIMDREQRCLDREEKKIAQELAAFRRHVDETKLSAGLDDDLLVRGLTMLLEEADNLHFPRYPEYQLCLERDKIALATALTNIRDSQQQQRESDEQRELHRRMMSGSLPRENLAILL